MFVYDMRKKFRLERTSKNKGIHLIISRTTMNI